jgi:hypothetical protein
MVMRLLVLLALAAVVFSPDATSKPLVAPTGVHAFMLRADEPYTNTFSRTPSFAWEPYEGATRYDFQLATSSAFDDRTLFWSTADMGEPLRVPAVSIPLALPWMTGHPYALYVRVRAHTAAGTSRWSTPLGFNTSWSAGDGAQGAPQQIYPELPGLLRWTPIDGATSYQVWINPDEFPASATPGSSTASPPACGAATTGSTGTPGTTTLPANNCLILTTTNVADERDFYPPQLIGNVPQSFAWRVRAVRELYGQLPNNLPRASYGPWSQRFPSVVSSLSTDTPLMPVSTASDVITTTNPQHAQTLTPGFVFSGGFPNQLFRVYVATDRRCVNIVYTGSVVGSPAYAPRLTAQGPGAQPGTMADGDPATPNEAAATVDPWDMGRPNARYWWTVVPVVKYGSSFRDLEIPQDACEQGRVMEFAKSSAPVATSATRPYVSGLSRFGAFVAATKRSPSFSRAPLVAWEPAKGATRYEVQWSRGLYPWKSQLSISTAATSALAQKLAPGVWYYRVRGINDAALGFKEMTWSAPVKISIDKPRFFNESNVSTKRVKK